jgi:hypothetical protein
MIGIYLHPALTQVIAGSVKKNQLVINDACTTASAWNYVMYHDVDSVANVFAEIVATISAKHDEYYIVLPDAAFSYIDCVDITNVSDRDAHIAEKIQKSKDDLYFAYPVEYHLVSDITASVYAIDKTIIDTIIAAAKKIGIAIMAIEPASIAYLRDANQWQQEHFLLDTMADKISIVSYSPTVGIFMEIVPELPDDDASTQGIKNLMIQHDYAAQKTFDIMNENIPYTLFGESNQQKYQAVFKAAERYCEPAMFPAMVQSDFSPIEQREWGILVGTLLQVFERETIYTKVPREIEIGSANVLPQSVKLAGQFSRLHNSAKKWLKVASIFLFVAFAAEIFGTVHYSGIKISPALQQDYDQAQASADVDKELEILNKAKAEHQYPAEAITALVLSKPQGVGLTELTIGKSKDVWISLAAVSGDAMAFRDYAGALKQGFFTNVDVKQIDTDTTSNFKKAQLTAGRGDIQ